MAILDSFIGGLLNLAGATANAKYQNQMLDKQLSAQKDLQDSQNQWSEQMMDKNNEYNSPAHMLSLYEDAGLNPAMFLNSANPTSASATSPAMSAPSPVNPPFDLSRFGTDMANLSLIKSQTNKNDKEAGLTEAQTITENALRDGRVALTKAQAGLTEEQKKKCQQETDNLVASKAYTEALTGLTNEQKELYQLQAHYLPMMNDKELERMEADIKLKITQGKVNDAQRSWYYANLELVHEQANTERHKQKNLDANTSLASNTEDLQNSQKTLNYGEFFNVAQDTKSKELDNKVREETLGTEVFAKNVENVTTPFLNILDKGSDIVTKRAMTKVAKANANTNRMNANTARAAQRRNHANPRYRR